MATYKVLQDIEAEDKLVGPLTLRQFIYAIVTIVSLYICFLLVTKGAPYLIVVFLPPALVSGFFAFPWGREQPTEIWALAKIRFMLKPRRRIWNQSGVKELVTVTAPKRIETVYTNGLSETEVTSRLKALADTIDSRGWAIKNIQPGIQAVPALAVANPADSDRLVGVNVLPQVQPIADVQPSDDMLDEKNNPVARQFDQMIMQSNAEHRERIIQEMTMAQATAAGTPPQPQTLPALTLPSTPSQQPATTPPNDYWFLGQAPATGQAPVAAPNVITTDAPPMVNAAEPTADEEALARKLKEQNKDSIQVSYGHLRTIQPISAHPPRPAPKQPPVIPAAPVPNVTSSTDNHTSASANSSNPPVTHQPNPATLKYVNNDDLTVATIARQVNDNPPDEIVISLH